MCTSKLFKRHVQHYIIKHITLLVVTASLRPCYAVMHSRVTLHSCHTFREIQVLGEKGRGRGRGVGRVISGERGKGIEVGEKGEGRGWEKGEMG